MKKNISRMFLAVFMVVTFLCCLNMTAFAEQPDVEFTGTEDNLSASVSTGNNTTVEVVVSEAQKTDINAGDKLIVTNQQEPTILHNDPTSVLDEAEFVDVIAAGSMTVTDEHGTEKVVRDSADINHNNFELDGDTDNDGCVTTYVTQKFSTSQLSGVMNQTKDLIFKSQLANPGTNDKDPEVTYIQKDQIKAVDGGYTVTVSFDGIRDWIFGLVNRTITMDYDLKKVHNNEEMTAAYTGNVDIALLASNVPIQEGSAMFKLPNGSAKSEITAANINSGNGIPNSFAVSHYVQAPTFDSCTSGYIKESTTVGSWFYECEGGGNVQFGKPYNGVTNYNAYTFKHAEFTADEIVFELKDKSLKYMPGGDNNFAWDDVELYYVDAEGEKLDLRAFSDFVDCYMNAGYTDGTITVCVGGIYKTITLPEWAPTFYFNPYTVGGLIEKGYYSDFLFNENGNVSVKVDFAMDANNADNNAIYVTAEPNADGKFEPLTMKFNPDLFRHLGKAAVRTFSLTMGNDEISLSYQELAALMEKYNGMEFIMNVEPTADGVKVTATVLNKAGQMIDVSSELNIKISEK